MNEDLSPELAASLARITAAELSPAARLGHVLLLLAAAAISIVIASLLATEPTLPLRTRLSFALMLAMGLSWIVYSTWALTHVRSLLANLRVVAGRMAVAFTAAFAFGALGLGIATGTTGFYLASGLGAGMLAIAIGLLVRAHRHLANLQARRRALESDIKAGRT
jgi:hypothetical protein